jgi:hypothetical protein
VKYVKPNTEHLEATLKALEVNPRRNSCCWRQRRRHEMRKRIEGLAIGLTGGVSSPKDLINAGANYLITSITDFPSLIEHINKTIK